MTPDHESDAGERVHASSDDPVAWDLLRRMVELRQMEEALGDLVTQRSDSILNETVLHLGRGQEALAVAVGRVRRRGDLLFSTHRGIGHCIAWGADTTRILAECLGRRGGYAHGLGGHMHIVALDAGIAGTNGIVGGGLTLAVGAGMGLKMRGERQVVFALFGDGAVNTGAFAEALNMAATQSAPVLFVCENNEWSEMTESSGVRAGEISSRATSYGMGYGAVDGRDVQAVLAGCAFAEDWVRTNQSPYFLECRVPRISGHWAGDPQLYRPGVDKSSAEDSDPIERLCAAARISPKIYSGICRSSQTVVDDLLGRVLSQEPSNIGEVYGDRSFHPRQG